jgi:hypothetical protein
MEVNDEYLYFLEYLQANPFNGNQQQCGKGKDYWNADMWTIEVLRYLMFRDKYTLPLKFLNNRNADPNRIKKDANVKLKLKKVLQDIKDKADVLLIGEVGRGLDILISNQVKKWKQIICYDQVDYKNYLTIFDNVKFICSTTATFDSTWIDKHIFILNNSIYKNFNRFKKAEHGIIDRKGVW